MPLSDEILVKKRKNFIKGNLFPIQGGSKKPFEENMIAWYDFSKTKNLFTDTELITEVTEDGQTVQSVKDLSGNNRTLTGTGTYVKNVQAGKSVVRLDGNTQGLAYSSATELFKATTGCIFFVASTGYYIYSNRNGVYGRCYINRDHFYLGSAQSNYSTVPAAGEKAIYLANLKSGGSKAFINGQDVATNTNTSTASMVRIWMLGGDKSSSGYLYSLKSSGDLCEVIFYNRTLLEEEYLETLDYLNGKWKIY